MPKRRQIDGKALLKMIKEGSPQSEILEKFGFKNTTQLKVAYANALMESGGAPKIKGKGRTGKGKPVKTEVSVNARGTLVIPKALVESLDIPKGQVYEVKQTGSGIQLKKEDIILGNAVQDPVETLEQPAQAKVEPEQPPLEPEPDESPDEKPIETPTEKAEELEPEESAVQEPVEESEKPAVEPKKETIAGTILNLIKSKPKGVDTKYIMEQTGFKKNQVWATVNSAKKKGQIKTTKRGIYVSVKAPKGK